MFKTEMKPHPAAIRLAEEPEQHDSRPSWGHQEGRASASNSLQITLAVVVATVAAAGALGWWLGRPVAGIALALAGLIAMAALGAALLHVLVTALEAYNQRLLQMDDLRARICDSDGPTWIVRVNEVSVHAIKDDVYAQIQLNALTNGRLYVAQAMNLLQVALNTMGHCLRLVPIVSFWVLFGMALLAPQTLAEAAQVARQMAWGEALGIFRGGVTALAFASIGGPVLLWCYGKPSGLKPLKPLGLVDTVQEAIDEAVRLHCRVAVQGSIRLSRQHIADRNGFNSVLHSRIVA